MTDLLIQFLEPADFIEQNRTVFGITDVGLFYLVAEIPDFLLERTEQIIDVGLVLFCEAVGFVFQDLVRKVLEIKPHLFLGIPEDPHFFIGLFPGLIQQGLKP